MQLHKGINPPLEQRRGASEARSRPPTRTRITEAAAPPPAPNPKTLMADSAAGLYPAALASAPLIAPLPHSPPTVNALLAIAERGRPGVRGALWLGGGVRRCESQVAGRNTDAFVFPPS
jgi:hypothetical protein